MDKPTHAGSDPRPCRGRWLRWWRGLRISVLAALLVSTVTLFYLNRIGLPESLKHRVVQHLRDRGWEVEFSRLRLRWYRGIVAEDLHFQRISSGGGPCVFLKEAQCRLNYRAILRLGIEVDGLVLEQGRMIWRINATNLPSHYLQLEDLEGQLWFHDRDRWQLRNLRATSMGARFVFNGNVTNFSALASLRPPPRLARPPPPAPTPDPSASTRWWQAFERIQRVKIHGVPEFTCEFQADGLQPRTFEAKIKLDAPAVESPWVSATNVALTLQWFPARHALEAIQAELSGTARQVYSRWGQADTVQLYLNADPTLELRMPTNVHLAVELMNAQTRGAQADQAVLTARSVGHPVQGQSRLTEVTLQTENLRSDWGRSVQGKVHWSSTHPLTNWWPMQWSGRILGREIQSRWGSARAAGFSGDGTLKAPLSLTSSNLAQPDSWAALAGSFSFGCTNFNSPRLALNEAHGQALLDSPHLQVSAGGTLAQGGFGLESSLDTTTRTLSFDVRTDFDPRGIRQLLTTNAQNWLSRYDWDTPPVIALSGSATLPPWDKRPIDWRTDLRSTLACQGTFAAGGGSYRGATYEKVAGSFDYRNVTWQLHQLRIDRPEGSLTGQYTSNLSTRDFHWQVRSELLPQVVQPLLESDRQRRVFDHLDFQRPPKVDAEIWGNWKDRERLSFRGTIEATHLAIRGEPLVRAATRVYFTNQLLHLLEPKAWRTLDETGRADGILIDLRTRLMRLTNATGRLSVAPVSRMISPKAEQTLHPYRFLEPIYATVQGVVDLQPKRKQYDLDFLVDAGHFEWLRFHLDRVQGRALWLGETLVLTNVAGRLHQGALAGDAWFDFVASRGAQFRFRCDMTNVNFHTFTEELGRRENHLEGKLSGTLAITNAFARDWLSWNGYGTVLLEDGLIWDIPVFGVFSPVFNAVSPGLGNSRARQASSDFVITNSILHTRNLDVHATAMRMQFRGRSDFQRRLEGRMEAELLRDMPAVGIIVSRLLWPVTKLFEYRITGTVMEPKTEPVYILPRILLLPLQPIKSFREIFLIDKTPAEPLGSGPTRPREP